MSSAIEFRLNGKPVRVDSVSPNTTLLEWLRTSGLTGTKEGCAEGDCGACSVAIVDRDARGKRVYRAINSCLVPLPLMSGRDIITVEGVGCPKMHPVQQAMVENFGSQCGYCTPGFVMSMFEGYYRNDLKTAAQLDEQLCGNLCRCTGYRPIRDAAADAFAQRNGADEFDTLLKGSKAKLKAARYTSGGEIFLRPNSLERLFRAMTDHPEARLIAGATELGLDITKKFHRFPALISLEAIPELTVIASTDAEWHIGAANTLTRVDEAVGDEYPELREMLLVFGSRQIRNRATLGGNLVTASPIGDSAPVLLSLGARVLLASASGERTIPLDEFFVSYRKTALAPGEILKTVIVPRFGADPTWIRRFYKVSKRREMDISAVAGAFAIQLDDAGVITQARLAYGGVAALPARALKTEQALIGKAWSSATCEEVLSILETEFTPLSDVRGSASYRSGLVKSLLQKFFAGEGKSNVGGALMPRSDAQGIGALKSLPHSSLPHESAHKHVTGEAVYVDDHAQREQMLEVWPVCSPHAHAKILRRDATAARRMHGVHAVLLAEDVPGLNDVGAVRHDEVLLADNDAFYHGQIIALVVGETEAICRAAAEKVVVEYELLPPIFTIEEAIEANSFHTEPNYIRRGDVA
ncbi:MAG: xanthine dehydrogenase small subunit, partial [Verrucomicrobiota bacterium]|nr:xanthine dehydrogenase small subunit [Verrucomicrobiota bacterium]